MSVMPQPSPLPHKKKSKGCFTCLIILGSSLLLLVATIVVAVLVLRALGISGRSAKYVYQQAPDLVASQQLSQALDERSIVGVSVYVIPLKGQDKQGAFIILDASKGYTGLSPLEGSDEVFVNLLRDLTYRNRTKNLRISHLTVEYRDEQGIPLMSFTVDQEDVERYADGLITQEEFSALVHFNLVDTLLRMGLDEILEGSQP